MKAVALNKDIALHATRKELTEAMILFDKAVTNGWANSHTYSGIYLLQHLILLPNPFIQSYTYSAAINANIRCGDISGASRLFKKLRDTKGRGLKMDVITCTTMMKGYTSIGDIASSLKLFQDMSSANPRVIPNIRTINTFLRGCVTTGTYLSISVYIYESHTNTYL
jgi:pentatricopeptide repeat protein